MSFVAGWVAIGVGAFAAYGSKKQSSIDARILRENAADLRELAKSNAEAYKYAGEVNADAVLTVGEANATMVERETVRALQMYGLEAAEERRLHVLSEKQVAGDIRATVGGSGVMTNTGSPLHYLHSQVKLGIQTRRFGDLKTYWSLKNIQESGEDKAAVIRLTAEQEARVIRTNAAINAQIAVADAERQAAAMERGAQGVSSMSGLNALNAGLSAGLGTYTSLGGSFNFGGGGTNYSMGTTSGGFAAANMGWSGSQSNFHRGYGYGLGSGSF